LAESFSVTSDIKELEDKDSVKLEQLELEVIHVPGHTPGGIALLMKKPENNIVFTGDSLFYRSIGRTDFPGASSALLIKSIKEKLFKLNDDTIVYPGHGPSSTIGEERHNNPFLKF
jgi:hydroxyacylglutathione hydrolase